MGLALAFPGVARALPAIGHPQQTNRPGKIVTVLGPVSTESLGVTLIHEHILVDFSGFQQYDPDRWNDDDVIRRILPYLQELKDAGCQSLVDCTPNFLGRDPGLLKRLSESSGIHILTNTGYYGGSDHKYLPPEVFSETAVQLASRWTKEATDGLGAGVYPGFIKISVNPGALTEVSRKLVTAAALAHLRTGLTIASHTGPAVAAFEEMEILRRQGVAPEAFIWVHAQGAAADDHIRAAKQGTWVSLDGLADDNVEAYVVMLQSLKNADLIHRTLISHDAGWYEPGKPDGGNVRGFTTLFRILIPRLKASGFPDSDIHQLTIGNPASAFEVRVRKL